MSILKVDSREESNNKRLRREGQVPAVIFGKHLEKSIPIKLSLTEATKLVRDSTVGAQFEIKLGKKKIDTMLKDIQLDPVTYKPLHLDFQALTSGEKVTTSIHLSYINKDKVASGGIVQELVAEIKYESLPKDLIEHLEVDLSGLEIGDSFKVSDLSIAKDEKYNLMVDMDADLVIVSHANVEAAPEVDENGLPIASEPVSAEPELVGKKDSEEA